MDRALISRVDLEEAKCGSRVRCVGRDGEGRWYFWMAAVEQRLYRLEAPWSLKHLKKTVEAFRHSVVVGEWIEVEVGEDGKTEVEWRPAEVRNYLAPLLPCLNPIGHLLPRTHPSHPSHRNPIPLSRFNLPSFLLPKEGYPTSPLPPLPHHPVFLSLFFAFPSLAHLPSSPSPTAVVSGHRYPATLSVRLCLCFPPIPPTFPHSMCCGEWPLPFHVQW